MKEELLSLFSCCAFSCSKPGKVERNGGEEQSHEKECGGAVEESAWRIHQPIFSRLHIETVQSAGASRRYPSFCTAYRCCHTFIYITFPSHSSSRGRLVYGAMGRQLGWLEMTAGVSQTLFSYLHFVCDKLVYVTYFCFYVYQSMHAAIKLVMEE